MFDAIVEAMDDGVLVVDVRGHIKHANSSVERMSGRKRGELAEVRISELLLDEPSGVRSNALTVDAHGENAGSWLVTKTGERIPVSVSGSPIVDPTGAATDLVLVVRSARELRQALIDRDIEIERRRNVEADLLTALRGLQHRATLGALTTKIASDLHAVAVKQRSQVEHLSESGVDREVVSELDRINSSIVHQAHRLARLTRLQPDRLRRVNLTRLVQDVLLMLEDAGKLEGIEVVSLLGPAIMLSVSRVRIEQVLIDLLLNAIEALDGIKGSIMIATHPSPRPQRIIIEISDTGAGISASVLPSIFEPLMTTKRARGSIGIGLTVVREIVEGYGGAVKVASTVGIGTTVQFDLPLATYETP